MNSPRFSVVVPTRGGATTLPATLRTCLDQDFDDYEIVVCDNDGPPEVKQAIDSVSTPRVRYVRSPRLLPMSENWDFAVSHARGEFVTVLGNDDGLLPHALREADHLLRETAVRALRWGRVEYIWPCHLSAIDRNHLYIPIARHHRWVDGRQMIAEVVALRKHYWELPMIYNSFVHADLLAEQRSRCGQLFPALNPDVYSAFAIGYLAGHYLSLDLPLSINGGSGNSNGAASMLQAKSSSVSQEFHRLNAEKSITVHPRVPPLTSISEVNVADSFLHAREAIFPNDADLVLDRWLFAGRWLDGLRARTIEEWRNGIAAIRNTLADDADLLARFDALVAGGPQLRGPITQIFTAALGYRGDHLHLDASEFGVRDVYGAARLCEKLLAYRRDGVTYDLQARNDIFPILEGQIKVLTEQVKTLDDRLNRSLEARVKRLLRAIPVVGPLAKRLLRDKQAA